MTGNILSFGGSYVINTDTHELVLQERTINPGAETVSADTVAEGATSDLSQLDETKTDKSTGAVVEQKTGTKPKTDLTSK